MFRHLIPLTAILPLAAGTPSESDLPEGAIILDMRTPGEYAGGHLDGAQLVDFNAGEVQLAIPELDPNADYLVYCRSGNRSGQGMALMQQAGFTSVTNLGSLEDASTATGINIVQ
ncbi:rhodanese-like domain-containing protein [Flaviflexus sp.]|uniref:rhodanese-like domain-containing protein n=1 Tax=Flaviflexus sp. TaxID=1969482 RepID=UPI003F92BC78